ncbi:MAG: diaminopimelate decarboxylase family protein [Candidatus Odinarchaeia archaeon]
MILLNQYPHLKSDDKGNLVINGVNYNNIIKKLKTPIYVYSLPRIDENCKKIKSIIDKIKINFKIFYSYKTNLNRIVCQTIHKHGIGAEVTSLLELKNALKNNVKPEMIIFDGPYKTQKVINVAIKNRINLINIDSLSEFKLINKIASKYKIIQNVGLTINPELKSKIGINIDDETLDKLEKILKKSKNINIVSLHCHMKTQNYNLESYGKLIRKFHVLSEKIKGKTGFKIKIYNIGGGFPEAAIVKDDIDSLTSILREAIGDDKNQLTLYLEPGRFLVGDAVVLLSKIIRVKKLKTKWLIIDAGSNVISPFSRANYRFIIANKLNNNYSERWNIGGPLPASFDVLNRNYCLPKDIKEGEIIAVLNTGAYCNSFKIDFNKRKINEYYITD